MTPRFESSPPFIGRPSVTLLIVLAALAFYAFDAFMLRLERAELAAEARSFFAQAQGYAAARRTPEALEMYRRAAALDRTNRSYQVAFARALITSGRLDQAHQVIADRVQQETSIPRGSLREMRSRAAQLYLDLALEALAQCPPARAAQEDQIQQPSFVIEAAQYGHGSAEANLRDANRIWALVERSCAGPK